MIDKTAIEKLRTIKRNMELTYHYCEKCGEADPSTNEDTYTEICDLLAAIEAEKPAECAEECLSKMFRDIRQIGYITDPLRLTNESHDACIDLLNHFAESYHAERCKACRKDRQPLPEAPRV